MSKDYACDALADVLMRSMMRLFFCFVTSFHAVR